MPRKSSDFSKAKVYSVASLSTGKQYIGSTCNDLSKRFSEHKSKYRGGERGLAVCDVIACGDANIYLLENVKCKNLNELRRRESEIIDQVECVNKYAPGLKGSGSKKCPCGSTVRRSYKARHEKTQRHKDYLQTL